MNKGKNFSLLIITAMFFAGIFIAQISGVPVKRVMQNYSYDVLVILIIMELFTGLVAQTGIMQKIAVCIVSRSEGMRRPCLIMFGAAMFAISACLNNITAVMMITNDFILTIDRFSLIVQQFSKTTMQKACQQIKDEVKM